MSIPSFDPSRVLGYGTSGQETARKMASTLKAHLLSVSYNADNKKFTIHNTSDVDKETIKKIFSEAVYEWWRPQVLDETDEAGNRLAQLRPVIQKIERATVPSLISSGSRDAIAEEVVSNMTRYLEVSFSEKTCLDIGCRSGENAVAMANAGAQVIGIDPDDSEFEIAKINGMASGQLVKATLQEYHAQFPDQQFDIITLFLWNLPFSEREEVGSALAQIIKPEGTVIVSYQDAVFNDGYHSVPNLMNKFFGEVEKFVFPGWNRYMLKCSYPIC